MAMLNNQMVCLFFFVLNMRRCWNHWNMMINLWILGHMVPIFRQTRAVRIHIHAGQNIGSSIFQMIELSHGALQPKSHLWGGGIPSPSNIAMHRFAGRSSISPSYIIGIVKQVSCNDYQWRHFYRIVNHPIWLVVTGTIEFYDFPFSWE